MPNYHVDEPYIDVVRRALGEVFVAEDVKAIFFNIAAKCPQVVKERPQSARHDNIEFKTAILSLQKERGLTRSAAETMIVRDPYLIFKNLEETPVDKNKKEKGKSHSMITTQTGPSVRWG